MLLQKGVQLVRSLVILYIMLLLGNLISHYVPVGIPGSIWGLLILFIGLTTRIIRLEWIYLGSSLLIRYMAVLFVPVSVGIIKYYDLLVAQWKILLIPNILSTFLTLFIIAFLGNYLFYKQSFTHKRQKVLEKRNIQAE
ncbi:CidA/LrgA family protein [Haemophilus sp. SZY H57]|uniref:CidA/LrgA family protein n=1 Tax=Haemophilus TaxID=724 RepID=UPI000A929D04|nr:MULTISPECIES: CidA/LrgA family protein [Haemophilus]MDN3211273.1 CidA/LrgA family protein [Haemophilus sp. SZY H51]